MAKASKMCLLNIWIVPQEYIIPFIQWGLVGQVLSLCSFILGFWNLIYTWVSLSWNFFRHLNLFDLFSLVFRVASKYF